jgi:putative NADPH-quinone reductase
MRVLYVYCHPVPDSFHAAVRDRALAALQRQRHEVDLLDLYAEGFDPVLGMEERRLYHDLDQNRHGLEGYIERLQTAEALVVQFPTWCFGPPAMLKGWLDRLILPGVAFDLSDPSHVRPMLQHIRHLAGIVTYGRSRRMAWYMGDSPRKLVTRYLRWFAAKDVRVSFQALYGMNTVEAKVRTAFIARVERAMIKL